MSTEKKATGSRALAPIAAIFAVLMLGACDVDEGPGEEVGEEIDETVEETGDRLEEATD